LGFYNGQVSIRSKSGDERVKLNRDSSSPVWSLSWCPTREKEIDVLCITDWDQTLSFVQLNGTQIGKDRKLGYDPSFVDYFSNGDYIILGGSDKKVTLWTSEGIRLGIIGERDSWIWSAKVKPKGNYIAVGSDDGTIAVYQIVFSTVHGLYDDRYAYRENMTDVVVQHLSTDQKARIKCRDYVKKIAVYRDRMAVQLPDRVIVYELNSENVSDMHYQIKEKFKKKLDCNLLVVTSMHIILCLEKKLQMLNFKGIKEREWNLDALIRYIKVMGGPMGREGLLVGLKNGQILQIYIDNPVPIQLIQQSTPVRCLDLSLNRAKLAVVDENGTCSVYSLSTKELLFQEPNANSVAWNSEMEDMLCYSGSGLLCIKAGLFPAHQQRMQGFVVGFKGSRIFCLHVYSMTTIDVPQSASMERYMERGDIQAAYQTACLGVTMNDWKRLLLKSFEKLDMIHARKCLTRLKDFRYIDLIEKYEKESKVMERSYDVNDFLGDVMAYSGQYEQVVNNNLTSINYFYFPQQILF